VGNGSELRRIVHAARTPSEVLESVERFFEGHAAALAGPESLGTANNARNEHPAHGPAQHHPIEATVGT